MTRRTIAHGVGLLVACIAGTAQAQPDTQINPLLSSATNGHWHGDVDSDKEKGRKCYYGTCSSCSANCSTKASTLLCYNCCSNNGCDGNNDSGWCQDYCDGNASPWFGFNELGADEQKEMIAAVPMFLSAYADAITHGAELTQWDLDYLDGALARLVATGDEGRARWALLTLLEAYDADLIAADDPDQLDKLIGEIHTEALFNMGDSKLRSTARSFAADNGIQGAHDAVAAHHAYIVQLTTEGAEGNETLVRAFLRR